MLLPFTKSNVQIAQGVCFSPSMEVQNGRKAFSSSPFSLPGHVRIQLFFPFILPFLFSFFSSFVYNSLDHCFCLICITWTLNVYIFFSTICLFFLHESMYQLQSMFLYSHYYFYCTFGFNFLSCFLSTEKIELVLK